MPPKYTQDEIDDMMDYDDDFDDPLDDAAADCMLGPDGQCGAAGSEWCDFECPLRGSEHFAGSEAWPGEFLYTNNAADA